VKLSSAFKTSWTFEIHPVGDVEAGVVGQQEETRLRLADRPPGKVGGLGGGGGQTFDRISGQRRRPKLL